MASSSEREKQQIEAANASGNNPVVFIHGLWVLPSSWANWLEFFKQAGYAPLTPDWPDDPATVEEARANPDVLAKKTLKQVAAHTSEIINALDKKPAVKRRLADRPAGRHHPRRRPLHAPDRRRQPALRPITRCASRRRRRARTSRARRRRRRKRIHLPHLDQDRNRRARARLAEQRRLHQRRRQAARRRHLRDLPRRMKRHDQLEEQCSFFVKRCVPSPARATS